MLKGGWFEVVDIQGSTQILYFSGLSKPRGKRTFFSAYNSFLQIPLKWSNFYMEGRSWHVGNYIFVIFINIENDPFMDQKLNMIFLIFSAFRYSCLNLGKFSIVLKKDRNAVSYMSKPFYRHITCT